MNAEDPFLYRLPAFLHADKRRCNEAVAAWEQCLLGRYKVPPTEDEQRMVTRVRLEKERVCDAMMGRFIAYLQSQ